MYQSRLYKTVIIEDTTGVPISEENLLVRDLDIQQAEEWEDRLKALDIPYKLVYAERRPKIGNKRSNYRFNKEYSIFVSKEVLSSWL